MDHAVSLLFRTKTKQTNAKHDRTYILQRKSFILATSGTANDEKFVNNIFPFQFRNKSDKLHGKEITV